MKQKCWSELRADGSVVLDPVDETAVFVNADGMVEIRQMDHLGEESVVVVPKRLVPALVVALNKAAADTGVRTP